MRHLFHFTKAPINISLSNHAVATCLFDNHVYKFNQSIAKEMAQIVED